MTRDVVMTAGLGSTGVVAAAGVSMLLRSWAIDSIARDVAATSVERVTTTAGSDWAFAAGGGVILMMLAGLIGSFWAARRAGRWQVGLLVVAVSVLAWSAVVLQSDLQLDGSPDVRTALTPARDTAEYMMLREHGQGGADAFTSISMLLRTELDGFVLLTGLAFFLAPALVGASAGAKGRTRGTGGQQDEAEALRGGLPRHPSAQKPMAESIGTGGMPGVSDAGSEPTSSAVQPEGVCPTCGAVNAVRHRSCVACGQELHTQETLPL